MKRDKRGTDSDYLTSNYWLSSLELVVRWDPSWMSVQAHPNLLFHIEMQPINGILSSFYLSRTTHLPRPFHLQWPLSHRVLCLSHERIYVQRKGRKRWMIYSPMISTRSPRSMKSLFPRYVVIWREACEYPFHGEINKNRLWMARGREGLIMKRNWPFHLKKSFWRPCNNYFISQIIIHFHLSTLVTT